VRRVEKGLLHGCPADPPPSRSLTRSRAAHSVRLRGASATCADLESAAQGSAASRLGSLINVRTSILWSSSSECPAAEGKEARSMVGDASKPAAGCGGALLQSLMGRLEG
jgi:hypothetical protein